MIGQFVLKVISYWLTANNRKLINFLSTQFFNLRKCIESIFEEHYNWNDSKLRYVYPKYFLPTKKEIMKKKSNNENFTRVSKTDAGG